MSRLSDNYSFTCKAHGTIGIDPNTSDAEVRDYMFNEHNERTLKQFNGHPTEFLALPYGKSEKETIYTPQYKKLIQTNFGILLPSQLNEIIVTHNGVIVDTMSRKELRKHLPKHYENSSIWKPAA